MLRLFVLLFLVSAVLAQEPEVNVELATPLVRLGGTVRLNVTVENTRDAHIQTPLPSVDGLRLGVPRGPNINQSFTIIQGRAQHHTTVEWTIDVRPMRAGDFEIPPLSLIVNGKTIQAPDKPMTLRVIEDTEGAEQGFLEIEVPEKVYEGQPFTVRARFGFDQDLPVDRHGLYLPWWKALRGVIELESSALDRGRDRIVVNDREETDIEPLDRFERGGSVMRAFEFKHRYLASRPGKLELDASTYQFGVTVERGIGFRPDRVRYRYAQSKPHTIEVLPIPEEGRPFEWSGAVGMIEASRRVDRRDLREGDTVSLTVSWTGDANLAFFDPPDLKRLDSFSGFRVVGTTDQSFADERRVRYDLVAADPDLQEIPAVPLWTFNPESERFERIETRPVPIRVAPVEDTIVGFEEQAKIDAVDIADIHTQVATGRVLRPVGTRWLFSMALGVPLLWWIVRTLVRRRGDPDAPQARRRRTARRCLARELQAARSASEQEAALACFLGRRTGESDTAWLGRDIETWLAEQGQPTTGPAAAWIELARDLDQRAWAGDDQPLERERILAVADQLLRGGVL